MSDPLCWIADELEAWAREGLLRRRREVRPLPNGRCSVDGQEVWDFASNDYLGLANDPRVVAAARDALQSHGVGGRASPLVSGRSDLHLKLEQTLADFEGTSAAILFPTGMAANMGTVAALAGSGDILFCDRLNHASLVDGCRVSGATIRIYRHHDLDELAEMMSTTSGLRKFIVTDTVFSMDGDLAPLPELCELAERYNAAMIVDEAHGTGVFGQCGRGVAELQGVEARIAVRIGTLSKAVGTIGGFVTGSRALIDFLWNKARTQVYSTSLPPAVCAAAAEAIRIIKAEPERRLRLQAMAAAFRNQLVSLGISPAHRSMGPIVPIVLSEPKAAMAAADRLLGQGFLVGAIRPPTVPEGTSRLRVNLHARISDEVLSLLATNIKEAVVAFEQSLR